MSNWKLIHFQLVFFVAAFVSCKRVSENVAPSLVTATNTTVPYSSPFQGNWKLLVFAGQQDKSFQLGQGEILLVNGNKCHFHFLDEPLIPNAFSVNQVEEVYKTDEKTVVFWKRSKDNMLLTVIDNLTREVDWRGSYLRDDYYFKLQEREEVTVGATAHLGICKDYWYDLYDSDGSPRYLFEPMKIDSRGYMK